MTNSEEPSAPDGLSSMSSSSSFKSNESFTNGTQNNHHLHQHNNGDLRKSNLGNGSAVPVPPTAGTGPPNNSVPTLVTSSICDQDNYSLQLPANQSVSVPQLGLPFNLICGEVLEHKTEISDGILALTSYRLFLQTKEITYNLPLGLIEQVECRDIFFVHLNCKDARSIRCTFPNNEAALEMMKRIQGAISPPKKVEEAFAFSFFKMTNEDVSDEVKAQLGLIDLPAFPTPEERFDAEIKRMEFNIQGPWRVSKENKDFELCGSYPKFIIVPCVMDKKKLEQVACFRSARRFPAVVWRHKGNGAVISRCSQPEVGWFGWRSNEDEELVQNIVLACADNGKSAALEAENKNERIVIPSSPGAESSDSSSSLHITACGSLSSMELVPDPPNIKKLLILDARSYTTAVANRARGGGCECLEYYTNCEIQFMNLANIHSIRKSFMNVRQLCAHPADQTNWYSQLENCKWLQHMSGLMKAAVTVATTIENEGRPVMVHCSDGWDRTPQIVALSEILLDPYYRSLEGFQVLVEREWLDFGHKFADRCGQGIGSEDTNERCPVFLQWLDCLHQLIRQFPTAFEFNLSFLVKLAQHTYSNLFGTFLFNTAKERQSLNIENVTHSIWRFLRAPVNFEKFRNNLYTNSDKVLWPSCEVRELNLWSQVYLGYDNPQPLLTEVINPSQESSPAPSVTADCESSERMSSCKSLKESKARSSSCENIHIAHLIGLQRRQSDPNLSDSFLGAKLDEVESLFLPQTEKMLTSASEDIHEKMIVPTNVQILETEDFSENEDTETNSEGKSEVTVINLLKSIESSTDTLVAESGIVSEPSKCLAGEIPNKTDFIAENCQVVEKTEGDDNLVVELCEATKDPDLEEGTCEVCETSKKLLLGDPVLSSTSTSTISTSSTTTLASSNVQTVPVSSTATTNGSSGYGSKFSSYNTPMHSRTPSTGIPATPEESQNPKIGQQQEKWEPALPLLGSLSAKSSYDVDGLVPLHDQVQTRLNVIVSSYRGKIETLERELQMTRNALMKQVCHKCTHHIADRQDDTASVADSLCSGENQSVGHESHSSEISWEAVEERDTRPPLWLPDYAVTKCMGCEASFWLGRRKHHCRLCGKIFCADCSENTITIPTEQMFSPVRVCSNCYVRLNNHSMVHAPGGISNPSNNPIVNGNGVNNHHHHHHHHHEIPRNMQNGYHRGSTSEYTSTSSSPKTNGNLIHRRLSEDLPRIHQINQQQWHSKSTLETNACNGAVTTTTTKEKDDPTIVNNGVDEASTIPNLNGFSHET